MNDDYNPFLSVKNLGEHTLGIIHGYEWIQIAKADVNILWSLLIIDRHPVKSNKAIKNLTL